jgi:hypothetical protein
MKIEEGRNIDKNTKKYITVAIMAINVRSNS